MASIRSRQTPGGTRYDVRFRVNGIQRTTTFRTHEDAKSFRRKVEGDELAGLVNDAKGGERLFGDYADTWVRQRLVKGRPLTPATVQGYRALLRRHLKPAFGATRLRQITPERVRQWHAETADYSKDQAAKGYRLLRAVLNTAVADGLIGRNPCTIRGAGIDHARERPMLDTATVLELAEVIKPRLRCLVLLGGFAGMRSGELLGLQRRDVDPLHGTVTVERQAHELTGLGRVLTPPKSEAGRRTVALPTFVLAGLEDHLRDFVAASPDALRLHPQHRAPAPPSGPLTRVERCLCGGGYRGRASPRPPAPRRHGDRPQSERHLARADGDDRPLVTRRRPPLPARHGGEEQGDRGLPRRRHQCGTSAQTSVRVRISA
jgi:integrase